jgi:hypothetical protein
MHHYPLTYQSGCMSLYTWRNRMGAKNTRANPQSQTTSGAQAGTTTPDPTAGLGASGTTAGDFQMGGNNTQQQQQPDNSPKLKSILAVGTQFSSELSKSPETEWVRKYVEKYNEITGDKFKDVYRLINIDGKRWGIPVSAMIIVGFGQNGGVEAYAAHAMLVEASAPTLNPYTSNYGGIQVEVQTVVGDLFTTEMWEVLKSAVCADMRIQKDIHFAGYSVLPVELNPEDTVHMQACISDAFESVRSKIGNLIGGLPIFQLSMLPKSDRLQARVDCTLTQEANSAGLPVRSDMTVTLTGVQNNQQQFPGMAQNNWSAANIAGVDFTKVSAYVDLVYAPPGAMAQMAGMPMMTPQMMAMDTRHFDPRVIMTMVESKVGRQSLEFVLLAIHQATLLSRNMAWATPFRPRVNKGLRTRDIGALGLDIPALVKSETPGVGDIIDTQSNNFDDNAFFTLLTAAIRQDPIYAIDIEEAGHSSWLLSAFRAAASNDAAAYQVIVKAADNLTNDKFSPIFASLGGGPIMYNDNNRIHLGYYTNTETGLKHDIRDLDYLCLLNLVGKTDHSYARQFEATYMDQNVPSEIRLMERYKILQHVLRDTMKLKGYAHRYTFYPKFLQALALAIQAEGFNITPTNLSITFGANQNRGFHNYTQFAFGQQNLGNAFSFAQPQMHGGGMWMGANQWNGFA